MKNEMVTRSQIRSVELYFEGRYELAQRAGITVAFDAETKKWFTAPDWWFQFWQTTYKIDCSGTISVMPLFPEPDRETMRIRNLTEFAIGAGVIHAGLLSRNPKTKRLELPKGTNLLCGTLFELWQNANVLQQQDDVLLDRAGEMLAEKVKKEVEKWQNDQAN